MITEHKVTYRESVVHGIWQHIRIWESEAHYRLFKAGWAVKPLLILPDQPNGITDEGMHYLLEVGFRSDAGMPVSQIAPWYAGLIDNAGFTGDNPSDTMASHTGWTEITTQYNEASRQTLAFPAASSRTITASVSFTMNASKTIQGIFVTSNNTKGGTTGTLWSTALFSTPPSLVTGNVLTANYSLTD
jgi:hypothetical protein